MARATLKAEGRLISALVWAELCSLLLLSCPHKYLHTKAVFWGSAVSFFLRLLCDDDGVGKTEICWSDSA